jgi:hypothetical protein
MPRGSRYNRLRSRRERVAFPPDSPPLTACFHALDVSTYYDEP